MRKLGQQKATVLKTLVSCMLKKLRNGISRIIRVWSLFCSIRVYKSLHFLPILAFCLSSLFVLCLIRCNLQKPFRTLHVLSRLSSYLHNSEKKLIFNSIIKFSYCPLVWMACLRTSNNMINKRNSKEILSIGYAVAVHAGYVKFIFKILDFYNVKSHTFVKLANLATIRNLFIYLFIYSFIYLFRQI